MPKVNQWNAGCAVFLLLASTVFAAPRVTLSKKIGPPTSEILVSGSGFEPNVGVDIYFDTKDEALVVTNKEGEFHNAKIHAPGSARPGEHWVTALERNNDKGNQEPFIVNTNWSQLHFDADGTRLNPYENVLDSQTLGRLNLKWSYTTGLWVFTSPAVVDDVVYVGSGDYSVYALNARSGAKLWSYRTGDFVSSSPAVANGVVYVGSDDSNFYALNARTGAKLWSYTTGFPDSAPVVANGVVYVGADGDVFAFDASTGVLLWSYPTGSGPDSLSNVVNGVIYVGSYGGNLYAINASTGTLVWSYPVLGGVLSPPTVANGVVYFGADDIQLNMYAVDASTGVGLWAENLCGEDMEASPAVANGFVYVVCDNGNVDALNPENGQPLWSYYMGHDDSSPPSAAVANGIVYVGGWDNALHALDAHSGALLWSYLTGGPVGSPVVANGAVYVGSGDFNVYAFSVSDNSRVRQRVVSDRPFAKTLHPDLTLQPQLHY